MKNIAIYFWYNAFVKEDSRFEVLFLALETLYFVICLLRLLKTN